MTDRELALALTATTETERAARGQLEARDLVEREAALAVIRLTVPLKRSLEAWIARRACRAAAALPQSL